MANNFFSGNKLTGGTAGALDDIDHSNLTDGDPAIVVDAVNDIVYHYTYNSSSATAESSPTVINPDSNGGNGRWILVASKHASFTAPAGATITEFSTDGTLAGDSDVAVPTEKAVKTYQDTWAAGTTVTEMGYVHGVTSDIQTQIDAVAYPNYVKVSEVQADGTDGGTFTLGAWRTRVLNTEDSDVNTICSLATNQITLSDGTYECSISAPAFSTSGHKIRLQNITGGTTLLVGTSEFSSSSANYAVTRSFIVGKFTVAASQALEVQHYAAATKTTTGLGNANNFGVSEVYTIAEFWKVG